MKTNNYKFDLMYQGQEHKNIMYNEAMVKIDAMLNLSIVCFIDKPPFHIVLEEKYIINDGEHKNKICYFIDEAKGVQYISPYNNMVIYHIQSNCFIMFADGEWKSINVNNPPTLLANNELNEEKFIGINIQYTLTKNNSYHFLYLEDITELNFEENLSLFTVIIKQNYQNIYEVKWPLNILWPGGNPAKISSECNRLDFFRFHKLPEENYFIAEIVSQNCSYNN